MNFIFLCKGAGSFHIHRKTMKDLWVLTVLGKPAVWFGFLSNIDFFVCVQILAQLFDDETEVE